MIDDADAIAGSAAAIEALDYLLPAMAQRMHIVLIARTELPLASLSKPRIDGSIVRITADDLLLREDEIAECSRVTYGTAVSPGEAAALHRITSGWGIALRLALRLHNSDAQTQSPADGPYTPEARASLFAYLANEVLSRVDERIATFLRHTAVLETLNPDVCGRLTGVERPAEIIQSLSAAGLPVLKTGWGTYRCHSLLRQYLLDPLTDRELRAAHANAARAFTELADWPAALEHFVAAQERGAALAVADMHGRDLYYAGHGRALLELAKGAPQELLDKHMRAEYWAAFAAARLFQLDWAARAFERVQANAEKQGETAMAETALRALAQLLNGWGRYPAALAVARQLLDSIPTERSADRAAITLGYLVTGMGATRQFREAVATIRELLPQLAQQPRADSFSEAYARCVSAVTLAMQGDFAAARAELNMARMLVLGREDNDIQTFVPWSTALVELNAAEPEQAEAAALAAEELALQFGDLQRVLECRALRAATLTMRGNVAEADRAFAQVDALRGAGADYWGVVLDLLSRPERARLRGDIAGALAAAETNHALAVSLGGARFVCSTRIEIAYFRQLNGDGDGAREHARTALDEATALDSELLIYGANLMLGAASREEEAAAMARALRIAEDRDYRFLMPYAVRLQQIDAALWRALDSPRAARSTVLLKSVGPQAVKALRAAVPELSDEAMIRAVHGLAQLVKLGRRALRELSASARRRVAAAAREALAAADATNPHRFSEREREVLHLLVEGLRTKHIAERLFLTPATVSTHIQRIMNKTGTSSRAELLALAAREAPGRE